MEKLDFDRGWRFHLGDLPGGIWSDRLDDSGWRSLDLPHDWSIELDPVSGPGTGTTSGTGFLPAAGPG